MSVIETLNLQTSNSDVSSKFTIINLNEESDDLNEDSWKDEIVNKKISDINHLYKFVGEKHASEESSKEVIEDNTGKPIGNDGEDGEGEEFEESSYNQN